MTFQIGLGQRHCMIASQSELTNTDNRPLPVYMIIIN